MCCLKNLIIIIISFSFSTNSFIFITRWFNFDNIDNRILFLKKTKKQLNVDSALISANGL